MRALYIGVDAGGTRTRAVVAAPDLVPLGRGAAGPANAATAPFASVVEAILEAVEDAREAAGVPAAEAHGLVAGVAGIGAAGAALRLGDALRRRFSGPRVDVVGDADVALAGAFREGVFAPGIVIIAGTGTVALGRNAGGDTARAGGWGPLIGDEGSAYAIGRRALAAVVADIDGRTGSTLMTGLLFDEEGSEPARELVGRLTTAGASPADVAAYFPLALEAARRQDTVALRLLREAGEELGRTAASVAERLGLTKERFRVACVGGVFSAGELVRDALAERLLQTAPRAEIGPAAYPPELGAVRLAATVDEAERAR
ncbi:MAG TPA: BadF/BadG/BcrA/BcrD ATPase family protein [Thermoanaerobaculia bacterium]|nr:BadF/BadG/BcrA/BcrD ATPase family protein [Thermoanaerobaculia bacterium]